MAQREKDLKHSHLIAVLREGVNVVQMLLFKELKTALTAHSPDRDQNHISMLCGSMTNTLFGTSNPGKKFQNFNKENKGIIEQELLALAENLPDLCSLLTDGLRIQTLCDKQEGLDAPDVLKPAAKLGILVQDREIPLPSSFMATIRTVGEKHNLLIAPVEISQEEDQGLIQ